VSNQDPRTEETRTKEKYKGSKSKERIHKISKSKGSPKFGDPLDFSAWNFFGSSLYSFLHFFFGSWHLGS